MTAGAAATRDCVRCGRAFGGKAGRMVGGRPACPSCANVLREPRPCAACGRMTNRLMLSSDHEDRVCEPCARLKTHATCSICRRHRPVRHRDDAGRPTCTDCGADPPVTHGCPACGNQVSGAGRARCYDCALADRVVARVAAEAAGFHQDWVRDLFVAFCGWDGLRRARGDMPRHIGTYARFFSVIDRACGSVGEVSQERLLEMHGAEGLRRGFQIVGFLAGRLRLGWDADAVGASSERRRVEVTMAAARGEPWAADLVAYRTHLATGRPIAPNTMRMYVAAAAALLRAADVRGASDLTRRHVARHLRRLPGRGMNVLRFLSWVADRAGQDFDPIPARRTSPRKHEGTTIRKAAVLIDRLGAAKGQREHRALLAGAISVVHGLPLKEVLALRRVRGSGRNIPTTRRRDMLVELAGPLAAAFEDIASETRGLAFPGRNGLQPLSPSTVRHHIAGWHRRLRGGYGIADDRAP